MAYFLAADASLTTGESLVSSGIGILIVFIGLICLIALVAIMGSVCSKVLSREAAPKAANRPAPVSAPAPAKAAAPAIENRDELIVAFSAAVAEELGTDVSAIRVVSFKQIG